MKKIVITNGEKETMNFASEFAKSLAGGNFLISLNGDLGAGKTSFVRGFAKGLGISENITSPTFTIMNHHIGSQPQTKNLYHFDMYRISSRDELIELGLEEYLDKKTLIGISIVEWSENIKLKDEDIKIIINKLGEDKREIVIYNQEAKDVGYLHGI